MSHGINIGNIDNCQQFCKKMFNNMACSFSKIMKFYDKFMMLNKIKPKTCISYNNEMGKFQALCASCPTTRNGGHACWVVNLLFFKLWLWLVVFFYTKFLDKIHFVFNLVFFFSCVFVLHTIVSEYLGGSCKMAKRQMCMLLLVDDE